MWTVEGWDNFTNLLQIGKSDCFYLHFIALLCPYHMFTWTSNLFIYILLGLQLTDFSFVRKPNDMKTVSSSCGNAECVNIHLTLFVDLNYIYLRVHTIKKRLLVKIILICMNWLHLCSVKSHHKFKFFACVRFLENYTIANIDLEFSKKKRIKMQKICIFYSQVFISNLE